MASQSKRTLNRQRNDFLLKFFPHPWFNHQCVLFDDFKLIQSFNPLVNNWLVGIYPASHYQGKVHAIVTLEVQPLGELSHPDGVKEPDANHQTHLVQGGEGDDTLERE